MELKGFLCGRILRLFAVAIFLSVPLLFAQTAVPLLSRPIMDTAGIVDEETQVALDEQIRALYEENGTQIAVLTVPSIGEESIEDFSMRVAREWKVGSKGADSGVLITLALAEHKVRIEVGYGLEGTLTDAKCGLIIRNCMTPAFKNDDYSGGIRAGVEALLGLIRGDEELNARLESYAQKDDGGSPQLWIPLLMVLIFFGIAIPDSMGYGPFACFWIKAKAAGKPFVRRKRPVVKGSASASGDSFDTSSHSFSTSSDDGDSFSGGGGDFGGGGASGSW
mgnify:CR=1 FL=1